MADTISFARGAPSLDIVDQEGLREAAQRAFTNDPGGTFAYGTSVGYVPLREWIAEQHGVEPDQVLVTNGSMQADAFLFQLLVGPGDPVVVESPTYDRTLLNLRNREADVHMVELETDGIDTAALRELLEGGVKPKLAHIIPNFQNPAGYTLSEHKRGHLPKLAHVIPNFQNPAGYTLSLEKRRGLLELAREHQFVIFEDDPYVDIRFRGESLPTMLSMDDTGSVVYASSFSKTVCPGIRVGYLVGPAALIDEIRVLATNTYISPNMVAQSIVNEFVRSGGMERSVQTVRTALAERVDRLTAALERELPEARFTPPDGGYFMWVELPEEIDVDQLFGEAKDRGVVFVKGTDFLLEGGGNTLRLAYSGVTADQIDEGIRRLAAAVRAVEAGATA